MRHSLVLGLLVFALTTNGFAAEANWPQWRGPNRDDISREVGLQQTWKEGGPEQVWLFKDCGLGYSGPAVIGDHLFILGARGEEELLICLQVADGKELWSASLGKVLENGWGNGPRSTPTVDGEHIYALSGAGNLVCLKSSDGSQVWSKTMEELGGALPVWGFSESPLVHDDMILCTPGGEKGAIAALDKKTGEVLWQTSELTDIAHYSSIMPTELYGKQVGIQLLVSQLVGFDLADGTILWSVPWGGRVAVIPTPIIQDNKIFITSGYGAGCMLVEVDKNFNATSVYDNKVMSNHHGGVIRIDDSVYGYSDKKGWTCQDFESGEKVWQERDVLGKGAIAYADGRFYCLSEDEGEVVLATPSKEGWQEHGRFTLQPQSEIRSPKGRIWTHPVITGGRLYLRDQDLLFSFDVTAN